MDVRPPIPAEIRRRVLVEAGHRLRHPLFYKKSKASIEKK